MLAANGANRTAEPGRPAALMPRQLPGPRVALIRHVWLGKPTRWQQRTGHHPLLVVHV